MRYRYLVLAALSLASSYSASYQSVVSILVINSRSEHYSGPANGMSYSYTSKNIDLGIKSFDLSNFLKKATSVYGSYYDYTDKEIKGSEFSYGGRFVFSDNLVITGNHHFWDVKFGTSGEFSNLGVEYYLSNTKNLSINVVDNGKVDELNVGYYSVHKTEIGEYYSINSQLDLIDGKINENYGIDLALAYYPSRGATREISLGFQSLPFEGDIYKMGFAFEYYFAEFTSFGGSILYRISSNDSEPLKSNVYGFSLSHTFDS